MNNYDGVERRMPDSKQIYSLDVMVRDHEKAINTLVHSTQTISNTLASIDKQLEKTTKTLEKLAEIEKAIVNYEYIKDDVVRRISKLEQSHDNDGCHSIKEVRDRVKSLEESRSKIVWAIVMANLMAILGLLGLHK